MCLEGNPTDVSAAAADTNSCPQPSSIAISLSIRTVTFPCVDIFRLGLSLYSLLIRNSEWGPWCTTESNERRLLISTKSRETRNWKRDLVESLTHVGSLYRLVVSTHIKTVTDRETKRQQTEKEAKLEAHTASDFETGERNRLWREQRSL